MTQKVVVVGHADADGHLIAEQTRRNLDLVEAFEVSVVVDPERTKDHKVWAKLDDIDEIDDADLVFFVDLMFAPATFDDEASALVGFVRDRPKKQFFLVDHHPLPIRRLAMADNLRAVYRPDVFECAFGPQSGMMVVAALCEHQAPNVAAIRLPFHDVLACGMRRAAALGGDLPGPKLMALLQSNRWDAISLLGHDDAEFHRLPRGRRPAAQLRSEAMKVVNDAAERLLEHAEADLEGLNSIPSEGTDMAYDIDVAEERFGTHAGRRVRDNSGAHPKDLELIVTLLEIAAVSLTIRPDSTFTAEQLIEEVKRFAGDGVKLEERDLKIVLGKSGFLTRVGSKEFRLK